MKYLSLLFLLVFVSLNSFNQNILFTSEFGGENNNGAIMNYDIGSGQLSTFKSLGGNFQYGYNVLINQGFNDVLYSCGLTLGQDGNYYGINEYASGIFNGVGEERGIFYRMNAVTYESEILFSFTGSGAFEEGNKYVQEAYNKELGYPAFTVIETSPGVFWGLAVKGGAYNLGGVWKFDLNTNTYSKIGEFDYNTIGHDPLCPMIIGPNNNLYGLLRKKGTDEDGYVYRVNTSTNVVELIGDLDAGAGWAITSPMGNIVYVPGSNKLYGVKNHFSSGNYGGGVFSYDLGTNQTTNETFISQEQISILGSHPRGLVMANDGHMYFVCGDGGAHNNGTIVRYTPGINTMVKMKDFQHYPMGTGFHAIGPKIYGVYDETSSGYAMWSFDVSSYTLQDIIPVSESSPGKSMKLFTAYDNGKIIGHFMNGGSYDAGSIFEYDISLGQTSVIQENASTEGRSILGELCKVNDSILIGFTGMGGNGDITHHSELGNLIKINIQTGNIEKLHGWSSTDKNDHTLKSTRPVYAANGKLYYSYFYVGFHGTRLNFNEYDFSTNQYSALLSNTAIDNVISGPLEYNNNIIIAWTDSVYVYDFNQQSFTLRKYSHDVSLYGGMKGNIMLASDGRIYGTTKAAYGTPTTGHNAVIYSLDVTNFDFQVEHTFDNVVRNTNIGLTELNGKLWGSTNFGGANNQGYLFSYDLTTNIFTNEYSFYSSIDGGGFEGEWTPVNGILYATSYTGGPNGFGTLVAFNPSNGIFTVKESLTIYNGRSFRGTPIAFTSPIIDSIVPDFATQNNTVVSTVYGTNTFFSLNSNIRLVNSNNSNEIIQGSILSIVSDTQMEVEYNIPVSAGVGLWDLYVDAYVLNDVFTVNPLTPIILYMDPDSAYQGEMLSSNIVGDETLWANSTPTVFLSSQSDPNYIITPTTITVNTDELIFVDLNIPQNAISGAYDLTVGTLVLIDAFTVLSPSILYMDPDSADVGEILSSDIIGENTQWLNNLPTVFLSKHLDPSIIILPTTVIAMSDELLIVDLEIPDDAIPGDYDLNAGSLVLNNAFTILHPSVLYMNPDSAYAGEILSVDIAGENTQWINNVPIVTLSYYNDPSYIIYPTTIIAIYDELLIVDLEIPDDALPGEYDLNVDGLVLDNAFTVYELVPVLLYMDPDLAYLGEILSVDIVGENNDWVNNLPTIFLSYHNDPTIVIIPTAIVAINENLLIVDLDIPTDAMSGYYNLNVDNLVLDNAFAVYIQYVPALISITPNIGAQASYSAYIIGAVYTTFTQGNTPIVKLVNENNPSEEIFGSNVLVISDTQLDVMFDIPFFASLTLYDLYVNDLNLLSSFLVTYSGAGLTDVNPDTGEIGDMVDLEIHGTLTQFLQQGVDNVYMTHNTYPDESLNAISFYAANDSLINASFGFPVNTSLGLWDMHVDDYSLLNSFELFTPTEQILLVDPDSAIQGDFELITITTAGTFFEQQTPIINMNFSDNTSELINAVSIEVIDNTTVEALFAFPTNASYGLWDVNVNNMTLENSFFIMMYVGIDQSVNKDKLHIYPNPVKNSLYLEANDKINKLDIFNIQGEKLISLKPKMENISLNTEKLNSGIYIVKVFFSDNSMVIKKFIKE